MDDFGKEKVETYDDIPRLSEDAWHDRLTTRVMQQIHLLGEVHGQDARTPREVCALLEVIGRCRPAGEYASWAPGQEQVLAHELQHALGNASDALDAFDPKSLPSDLRAFFACIDLLVEIYLRSLRAFLMNADEMPEAPSN